MLSQQPRASRALPSARVPKLSTANNDGSTCRELRFMSAWNLDEAVEQLERAEKLEGADERRRLDSPLLSRFERGQIGLSPRRIALLKKVLKTEIARRQHALAHVIARTGIGARVRRDRPEIEVKSKIPAGAFSASQAFSPPHYHKPCPRSLLGRAARSCTATGQLEGLCRC